MSKKKGRIGSAFDDFLREEGTYEQTQAVAIKRVLAWQLGEAMKAKGLTKSELARQMNTSRSQLNRLLDPENEGVELQTLARAAHVLGRKKTTCRSSSRLRANVFSISSWSLSRIATAMCRPRSWKRGSMRRCAPCAPSRDSGRRD